MSPSSARGFIMNEKLIARKRRLYGNCRCDAVWTAMLTVIIETRNNEAELAQTLSALVAGAVEGLVSDVIILDHGSRDGSSRVADAAGRAFLPRVGILEATSFAPRGASGCCCWRRAHRPASAAGWMTWRNICPLARAPARSAPSRLHQPRRFLKRVVTQGWRRCEPGSPACHGNGRRRSQAARGKMRLSALRERTGRRAANSASELVAGLGRDRTTGRRENGTGRPVVERDQATAPRGFHASSAL